MKTGVTIERPRTALGMKAYIGETGMMMVMAAALKSPVLT